MLITPVGLENMRFHQHPRGNSPCILVVLFSMASVILLSCTKNNKHLTITQLETWGFASTEFFRKQNCFQHVTGSDWYPCCWSCWLTLTCCICWGTAWVMMNCDFWSSVVEVPLLCSAVILVASSLHAGEPLCAVAPVGMVVLEHIWHQDRQVENVWGSWWHSCQCFQRRTCRRFCSTHRCIRKYSCEGSVKRTDNLLFIVWHPSLSNSSYLHWTSVLLLWFWASSRASTRPSYKSLSMSFSDSSWLGVGKEGPD